MRLPPMMSRLTSWSPILPVGIFSRGVGAGAPVGAGVSAVEWVWPLRPNGTAAEAMRDDFTKPRREIFCAISYGYKNSGGKCQGRNAGKTQAGAGVSPSNPRDTRRNGPGTVPVRRTAERKQSAQLSVRAVAGRARASILLSPRRELTSRPNRGRKNLLAAWAAAVFTLGP